MLIFLAMKVKIEESLKKEFWSISRPALFNQDVQPFVALRNIILLVISNE